ncbi:YbbC/YhhH family protein [Ralstonia solanacearum]|uniref:YbbC/YhhH family protein n=1 Tax=Ralstonia solanacearum TaxID=305 RepID=UPI0009BCCFFD|nr:YbbC/YhhH family protein [Ralstonia solanacearum]
MRYLTALLILCSVTLFNLLFAPFVSAQEKPSENWVIKINGSSHLPENGVIPDEQTAKKVAEAILIPIYGQEAIEKQKPFRVVLLGDIWVITGYFPPDKLGGVFRIEIAKQDGRVIQVMHEK